jgi:hypothetical protein
MTTNITIPSIMTLIIMTPDTDCFHAFVLSVTNNPFMMTVVKKNVFMLSFVMLNVIRVLS